MHLIIDGFNGDQTKMADLEFIYRLLDDYPGRIGMRKIMPPYVFRYTDSKPEDWGISGFVLIAESHISIHTFPDRAHVSIDIFSCKSFDAELATEHLRIAFGLRDVKMRILERGLEYPFDVQLATGIVNGERSELMSARS